MSENGWKSAHLDDIPRAGNRWIPVRRHFGIGAFGVNVWAAEAEGGDIIGEHDEEGGHEELYVVLSGHATFTVDGEEVDAPAGTAVFVKPAGKRSAVARDAGTSVMVAGAKPGEAFEVSGWEGNAEMWPLYEAEDYEGAAAVLRKNIENDPEPGMYYNLACVEALAGQRDEAIEHLGKVMDEPRFRDTAEKDSDLDSLRDDPRFVELLKPRS